MQCGQTFEGGRCGRSQKWTSVLPACRAADYRTEVRGGGFWHLNTEDSNLDLQVTTIRSALETPGESSEFMERSCGNRSAKIGGRASETKSRRRNKMTTGKRVIDVVRLLLRPLPSEISNGSENAYFRTCHRPDMSMPREKVHLELDGAHLVLHPCSSRPHRATLIPFLFDWRLQIAKAAAATAAAETTSCN